MMAAVVGDDLSGHAAIRKQVEFYFSDHNAPDDRFLRRKIEDAHNGFVSLELLMHFERLRQLTQDINLVSKALESSTELEMSEDGKFVRRRRPLPLPRVRIHRTVYVKGFRPDSTLKEVAQWCMQYGDLLTIVMRRNEAGEFKGSIFVEYVTEQVARNMVEKKPTPPHAIPDEEHEPVMMKMTYLNMKTAKYEKDDKTTENVELQAKLSVPLVYGKVALLRLESVPEGSKNADMEGLITSSNIPMMDFDLLFVVPAMALDVEDQNKTDGVWYCVLKPKRDDAVIPWASSNLKLPKTNVLVRCYVVDDENEATTTLTAIKAYFKRSAGASRKRGIADDGQGGLGITGNQTGGDSHQHGGRGRGRGRGRGNFNKRRFRSD